MAMMPTSQGDTSETTPRQYNQNQHDYSDEVVPSTTGAVVARNPDHSNLSVTLSSLIHQYNLNHEAQANSLAGPEQFSLSSFYQSTAEEIHSNRLGMPLQMPPTTTSSQFEIRGNNNLRSIPLPVVPTFTTHTRDHQHLLNLMRAASPRAAQTSHSHTQDTGQLNVFDNNILAQYYQHRFADLQQLHNHLHIHGPLRQNSNISSADLSHLSLNNNLVEGSTWTTLPPFTSNEISTLANDHIDSISRSPTSILPKSDGSTQSTKELTRKKEPQSENVEKSSIASLSLDELTAGCEMVCSEIQGHANGCMFVAFSQMKPCKVTEEDLIGKNKSLKVGMPGICCKNCGGSPGCGRFFPSTFNSFVNGTNPDRVLAHVGHICIHTPAHIRDAIHALERQEDVTPTNLRYGSRKSFFWYIWSKFQNANDDSKKEVSENKVNICASSNAGIVRITKRKAIYTDAILQNQRKQCSSDDDNDNSSESSELNTRKRKTYRKNE
jgi:hypothetical protein